MKGLVTSVGSRSVRVFVEGRGEVRCTLRGNLWAGERDETRPVAVGDRVSVSIEGEAGVVEDVEERDNRLARPVPVARARSGRTRASKAPPVQVIAANLDRIVIVAALNDPPFRPGLVDRFLVAADMQGVDPLLVLNKVDLPGERDVTDPYREEHVPVVETSCVTGEGIEALAELMSDGISLLVGHSGVGKSSLLNALCPELDLEVRDVTDYHGRGRHTTTSVTLLPLAGGGWVVDSPGLREFGLENVPPSELARLFPGFGDLPKQCRFSNCLHRDEPGCAVWDAVEADRLDPERYEGYLRILDDLAADGS